MELDVDVFGLGIPVELEFDIPFHGVVFAFEADSC